MGTAMEIQKADQMPVHEPQVLAITPMTMIDRALSSNATPDTLERLLALQERWEANEARKAFDAAMAAAKAEIPVIVKNRKVGYEHKDGKGETSYRHEDLGAIARTVDPILAKHGLSYRYQTVSEPNQPISVTCIVAHRDGHSEKNTLVAGRDDSGKKNSIQAIGSTITYLQRYTLKAALGLAASHDDDGKSSEDHVVETISEEQEIQLRELIEASEASERKFLAMGNIQRLSDLPAEKFDEAMSILKQRIHERTGR
jgi:hypothetical protein